MGTATLQLLHRLRSSKQRERSVFADLSEVGALLGFDCAVIGREYNAITVRRHRGEPDEDGVVWRTVIHPDPEARAKAVLTLAPPQRWSAHNPLQ